MPCMKDYGRIWDYEIGPYSEAWIWQPPDMVIVYNKETGEATRTERKRELPRYRKVANQYGVCKFIRIN